MQIAQVVPKTRTRDTAIFDYAIPPQLLPMIKPGILVEIPFHGRKLEGIIIGLKKYSPVAHLSSIFSIIDPQPALDTIHIKLAQWMSEYYLAPLGKTLFENIVPPAKRLLKKKEFIQSKKEIPAQKQHGKIYLIQSDFNQRLKFYLQAIKATLAKDKQIIILIPDLANIPFFTKNIKSNVSILHSNLSQTKRWSEWDKIRNNQSKIIIGSTSALFSPAKNIGLIIIDQEENETYKNDRSPHYHAVDVAIELSNLSGSNLLLGSLTPRIVSAYAALKGKFQLTRNIKEDFHKNITIVDMNSQKQAISLPLQEELEKKLKNNQKILLVLNRKGEGTKFSCADCNWTMLCQNCGLPVVAQKNEAVCFRCQKANPLPENCPNCQGSNLRSFGLTTKKLFKFVQDFWPNAKIIRIEKDHENINLDNDWDIFIVTNYALKFYFPSIDLVAIIDADQGLNFPDFTSGEKVFANFYKFLRVGNRGLIQTHLPENQIIRRLGSLDYEGFFLDELAERKKNEFPPFSQLVRLLYKNENEEKCNEETKRVFQSLNQLITIHQSLITILGPSPAFIQKERGKFRYQIIIKTCLPARQAKRQLDKEIKSFLMSLPKGWSIDVDPVNLL